MTDLTETIKTLSPLLTAAAAWCAAVTGMIGLGKWRNESLGKRKAEVAEATLASVYEMEEILNSARSPLILAHEMGLKPNVSPKIAKDPNYAPEARLLEYQEFFGRFRSQKFLFAALFGKDAAEAIEGLWYCRVEINAAVFGMLNLANENAGGGIGDYKSEMYNIAFKSTDKEKDKLG